MKKNANIIYTTIVLVIILASCGETKLDICKCLNEPDSSDFKQQNRKACDELISRELGVDDWTKAKIDENIGSKEKFIELYDKCWDK